jgi:hypothetical protein
MALSPSQKTIVNSPARFKVAVCGRRFGKTHLAIREIAKAASLPNQEVYYVSPSYRMSKTIAWRKLKNKLQDLNWVAKVNESELTLTLKNGSVISLKGADNYDSLRGIGLDYLVMDEFADIDPAAWYEVLRPALSDKQGRALFLGTPKGMNWAYELYQMPEEDSKNWASYQFTTLDGGNVSPDEVEAARKDLDERTFRQEYMATFETFSGRIYYGFERQHNVKLPPDDNVDVIYCGMDFNIDPMSVIISVRRGDDIYVIDEIRMFGSNTLEAVDEIKARYPRSKVWMYPDPAGNQRKTSAGGTTDIITLQNAGFVVKAPRAHTPVRDRINAVNSRLCSGDGTRHLFVSPKCKHTIEGLERQTYKEGTSTPDKESGYDHMMDALGYEIDFLFPIKREIGHIEQPRRWAHTSY